MEDMDYKPPSTFWSELGLPVLVMLMLLVSLWLGNDMSCTLPHFQP